MDMLECDVGGGFGVRGDFFPRTFWSRSQRTRSGAQ